MLDPTEIRRSFVSERRNLLLLSFLLFFYRRSGIVIDEINVLGNTAKISDPSWVSYGLWILWFYFLVRFYQSFRDIRDKGFWFAYDFQMRKLVHRSGFRRFKKSYAPKEEEKGLKPSFHLGGDVTFPYTQPELWSVRLSVGIAYRTSETNLSLRSTTYDADFSGAPLLWLKTKAVLHVIASTHVATEYALPFIVGLLPVYDVALLYVVNFSWRTLALFSLLR